MLKEINLHISVILTDHATVRYHNRSFWLAIRCSVLFHHADNFHARGDSAEHDVLPVKMGERLKADEELAAMGVGTGIGH